MKEPKNKRPSRFRYAPPLRGKWVGKERVKGAGKWQSTRAHVEPPYPGAPLWQCSVYYWWWEYLRCNEGYRETCAAHGQGKYAKLYADFGNVHEGEFWDWWKANGVALFAEPLPEQVTELAGGTYVRKRGDVVAVSIPLDFPMGVVTRQLKRMLSVRQAQRKAQLIALNAVSKARYPVASRPNLPALYKYLEAWKARQADPDAKLYELAAKLEGKDQSLDEDYRYARVDWTNEMARRIRKARELIGNVGIGLFPLVGEQRVARE